eukprot:6018654-Pyramimonas_sp.AAC.1
MDRLYVCPSCDEEREDILAKIRDNRPTLSDIDFPDPVERLLFTRGNFERPGDTPPRPLTEGGFNMVGIDGFRAQGDFHDGGCCHGH